MLAAGGTTNLAGESEDGMQMVMVKGTGTGASPRGEGAYMPTLEEAANTTA
jgi:hypothetical protein